jgi:hypothetical protein
MLEWATVKQLAVQIQKALGKLPEFGASALSEQAIIFFIESFLLSQNGESLNKFELAEEVDEFVKTIVRKITADRIWLPALEKEVNFQKEYLRVTAFGRKDEENAWRLSSSMLWKTITEFEIPRNTVNTSELNNKREDAVKDFYNSLAEFLVEQEKRLMHVGRTEEGKGVQRSAVSKTVASLLPIDGLVKFSQQSKEVKAKNIEEITRVFLGIRIFQSEYQLAIRQTSITGQETSELPSVRLVVRLANDERINQLAENVERVDSLDLNAVDLLKQTQVQLLCQKLLQLKEMINAEAPVLVGSANDCDKTVEELIQLSTQKVQAPKAIVYPLFERLAAQFVKALLAHRMISKLLELSSVLCEMLEEQIADIPMANGARDVLKEELELEIDIREFRLITKEDADFLTAQASLGGFCPTKLAVQGVLQFGNPIYGILHDKIREMYLCFNSPKEMAIYSTNAQKIIDHIHSLLAKSTLLMFLINLEQVQKLEMFLQSIEESIEDVVSVGTETGVQTPVHFVERYVDDNYFWNEWDLRKQALKMANIRNKKTIGCQTGNSFFKVDNETQIWPMHDKTTMTGVERGTNPIWPRNYIVGLRQQLPNAPTS